jgi:hypothetical protein
MLDGVVLGIGGAWIVLVGLLGVVDTAVPSAVHGLPAFGVLTLPANDEGTGDPLCFEKGRLRADADSWPSSSVGEENPMYPVWQLGHAGLGRGWPDSMVLARATRAWSWHVWSVNADPTRRQTSGLSHISWRASVAHVLPDHTAALYPPPTEARHSSAK